MKKFLAFILVIALLVPFAAFAETYNLATANGGAETTITMGTNAEFPPFEYVEGTEVVGVDVEIAVEIAKDLGLELLISNMAFDSVLPALTSGQIDLGIAAMTVKEERLLSVDFTDTYYNARQALIVKAGGSVIDEETLKDKTIGVQNGTTGDYAAEDYTTDIQRFGKALDAVLELQNGKLDAVIVDEPVAKNIVAALGNPDLIILDSIEFADEYYAIAVQKGHPELIAAINKTIARIQEDGTLDAILLKYFPTEE